MASVPQDVPVYRVLDENGFFDDQLYPQGTAIVWEGEPNDQMEPMNQMATDAMNAYFKKLDECSRLAAEKRGVAYTGTPRTLEEKVAFAKLESRRVQLTPGDGGIPIMGGEKRGPKARALNEVGAVPQTTAKVGRLVLKQTEG